MSLLTSIVCITDAGTVRRLDGGSVVRNVPR